MLLATLLGCSGVRMGNVDSDREIADKVARIIVESVQDDDIESFKALFPDEVSSMKDFDKGFEYLRDLIVGSVVDCRSSGNGCSESFDAKGYSKTILGGYDVITDDSTFELYFELITNNDDGRGPLGVVFLKAYDSDSWEEEKDRRSSQAYERLGVYNPSWDSEDQS